MSLIDMSVQPQRHLSIDPSRLVVRCMTANQSKLNMVLGTFKQQGVLNNYEVVNTSKPSTQYTDVILQSPSAALIEELVCLAEGRLDDSVLDQLLIEYDYEDWDEEDEDGDGLDDIRVELAKVGNGKLLKTKLELSVAFPIADLAKRFVDFMTRHVGSRYTHNTQDTSTSFTLGAKDAPCYFTLNKAPIPQGWCTYVVMMSLVVTRAGLIESDIINVKQLLTTDMRELVVRMIGIYDGNKYVIGEALCRKDKSRQTTKAYRAKYDEVFGNEKHLGATLSKRHWFGGALVDRIREIVI